MLNFAPTEEQEEIRSLAQTLAQEQLRPQGREAERAARVPVDLLRTLAQTGLTAPFPEEFGGSGALEALTFTLIAEELGAGDGAIAMYVLGSLMGPLTVLLAGNAEQQHTYLPLFSDEQSSYTRCGSLAFAERTGGYIVDEIGTCARRERDTFVITGSKRDVIHGAQSNPRVILARLEGSHGPEGLCAFLLPDDTPGLRITPDTHKLGLLAAPSAAYTLEHACVAPSYLLGEIGHPGVVRAATLSQILRAAVACGTARAGLEYAADYARQRIAFGRPIASYQGIAFLFSEMAMKLDAARLYLWRAATAWDAGEEATRVIKEANAAQHQAIKIAQAATIDTIQILGGAGFIQDHPAEMWMRNAAAMD